MWSTGRVPANGETVTITDGHQVVYDLNDGLVIGSLLVRGSLVFAGDRATLLRSGNAVCESTGTISHVWLNIGVPVSMRWFLQANADSTVVGRGDVVIPGDVGLWGIQGCRFNIEGQPKTPWTRLGNQVAAGATQINVLAATNWQVGDELVITPTEPPSVVGFDDHFDEARIAAINGLVITLDRPLTYPHPSTQIRPGVWISAEVGNLTRSVMIEGVGPGRRAHIWIMNDRPVAHTLRNVALRHMGPVKCAPVNVCDPQGQNDLVEDLGRYPVHFHRMGPLSQGSIVDGVVIRDWGGHAEVSHGSDGITWNGTVVYNGIGGAANWWDHRAMGCPECTSILGQPRDLIITSNLVARIQPIPFFRGSNLTAFFVGGQSGNIYRDNVGVGVLGNGDCSAFHWPEFSHGSAIVDRGNVGHNNRCSGIRWWQNDDLVHNVIDFVAYHNGWYGIDHGAYVNSALFSRVVLYGNGISAFNFHAMSGDPRLGMVPLRIEDSWLDAGGRAFAITTDSHAVAPGGPAYIRRTSITGATQACIALTSPAASLYDWLEVDAATTCGGNKYWITDSTPADSRIVDRALGLTLWRRDQSGRCANGALVAAWNAWACPL